MPTWSGLKLFTFLPLEDIAVVKTLADARLNMAKAVLAYEATKVTHGADAAKAAWRASMEAFHSRPVDPDLFPQAIFRAKRAGHDTSAIPRYEITSKDMEAGLLVTSLCAKSGLTQSMSEAKRLIEQGGIYINERQVKTVDEKLSPDDFGGGNELRIRKGEKEVFDGGEKRRLMVQGTRSKVSRCRERFQTVPYLCFRKMRPGSLCHSKWFETVRSIIS